MRKEIFYFSVFMVFYVFCTMQAEESDVWNGQNYHENSVSQQDTAESLIQHLSFQGNEEILDIGCGDGKITASLAEKVPAGFVTGIDISPSMIAFAGHTFGEQSNLHFLLMDAQELEFDSCFDLAVSFTAFHWIPNKQALIQGIWKALKPNGFLAFSVPLGPPQTFRQAIADTIADEKWSSYFVGFEANWKFVQPQEFEKLIGQSDFLVDRWEVVLHHDLFPSEAKFKDYVLQWLPHLQPLPQNLEEPFVNQLIARYLELENNSRKEVYWNFYCLEAIVQK